MWVFDTDISAQTSDSREEVEGFVVVVVVFLFCFLFCFLFFVDTSAIGAMLIWGNWKKNHSWILTAWQVLVKHIIILSVANAYGACTFVKKRHLLLVTTSAFSMVKKWWGVFNKKGIYFIQDLDVWI